MGLSTQQTRLQDDLRGLIAGDVRCDDVIAQLYATDASEFEARPLGVVWPRSTRDVAATVRYCAEHGISIHPRGSGTGTAGGALGRGLVLDFTRYMRRIVKVNEDHSVVVQPGAVRERFNDILKRSSKRFFAPGSGFLPTSTLGSIVSTDAAGPRWLKYGFAHQYVRGMEVVLASGEIHRLTRYERATGRAVGSEPVTDANDSGTYSAREPWVDTSISRELVRFLENRGDERPLSRAGRNGYGLDGVLDETYYDPARLFCGAEGSLGVITQLTLDTMERPAASVSAILLFDSLEAAVHSVERILEFRPSCCELIDRRIINLLTNRDGRLTRYLPSDAETALLLEFDSDSVVELADRSNAMIRSVRFADKRCFGSWSSIADDERELFGELLRQTETAALGIGGAFRTVSLLGDYSVPCGKLADFLARLQRTLRRRNLTCALTGHAGQGQIRISPILSATEPLEPILYPAACEVTDLVAEYGGSVISGAGCGLARSIFLSRIDPHAAQRSGAVKTLFDPQNVLNPGKIVPESKSTPPRGGWPASFRSTPQSDDLVSASEPGEEDDLSYFMRNTFASTRSNFGVKSRRTASGTHALPTEQLQTQLKWDRRQIASDVYRCTGCGLCRSRIPGMRSCPSFRHYPDEQVSCRAKANALRGILDGSLPLESLVEEDVRALGEQCIMCHCCPVDCPTRADVAKMAFRIRSAQNAAHGMSLGDKFLANFDRILKFFSVLNWPTNALIRGRLPRLLGEQFLGVAQGRKYPKLERFSFLSRVSWSKRFQKNEPSKERKVALFVDTFSNYFDVRLAEAAMKTLEFNGVEVIIPTRQRSSGHQAFALGHPERAASLVRANTALYADLIRQGCRVVTLEPLSAVCLGREYRWISDDSESRLLSENVTDITFYLLELLREGALSTELSPIPLSLAYHAPCRTVALTGTAHLGPTPAEELLRLIPELKVRRLERGCCGLAGPAGLRKSNYSESLRLGMPLFLALRDPAFTYGATECSFCRLQMEQGCGKPVVHPIKLLAAAYGLLPEPKRID